MADETQEKADEPKNKVGEPAIVYFKKRLRAFSSFEEMNDAYAAEMATLDGIQHLMNVTALLKRMYPEQIGKEHAKRLYKREGWTSY